MSWCCVLRDTRGQSSVAAFLRDAAAVDIPIATSFPSLGTSSSGGITPIAVVVVADSLPAVTRNDSGSGGTAAAAGPAPASVPAPVPQGVHVLIVDDDRVNRRLLERMLRGLEDRCVAASAVAATHMLLIMPRCDVCAVATWARSWRTPP